MTRNISHSPSVLLDTPFPEQLRGVSPLQ